MGTQQDRLNPLLYKAFLGGARIAILRPPAELEVRHLPRCRKHVSAETCAPHWGGQAMNDDMVVEGMLQR
ncbi:hypothetical protein [Wenzhouxiangella sp. XN201]|uniref:hypothetical protein n=1 Tax=Wenzhouxiangella sp. XN201 TaxID=2710755 RepID=UPI0013DCFC8E|nr:hypothetical protein [Wenzhouxiangella sp. XN201]